MSVTTYTNLSANTNPDVLPDVYRGNLYHASVHAAETKRLILVERQQVLHRATWLALATLAEVCSHLLVTLERLSAAEKQ